MMQRNPFPHCSPALRPKPIASMDQFRAGDQLYFFGTDPLSRAIAYRTCSWWQWLKGPVFSHVAICADVEIKGERPQVWLFESTTLCSLPCLMQHKPVSGVQCHMPDERVKEYPGSVWRLRLTQPLTCDQSGELSDFLRSEVGKPYDRDRAALLASWHLWAAPFLEPTPNARFCSELVGEGLKRVSRIGADHDPESLSPNSLASLQLHSGAVWPLDASRQSRRLK